MQFQMRHLLIVLLPFVSVSASSQPRLPPGVRGPDLGLATRSVSTYLALERDLLDALKDGNRAAVLRLLSEDFGSDLLPKSTRPWRPIGCNTKWTAPS